MNYDRLLQKPEGMPDELWKIHKPFVELAVELARNPPPQRPDMTPEEEEEELQRALRYFDLIRNAKTQEEADALAEAESREEREFLERIRRRRAEEAAARAAQLKAQDGQTSAGDQHEPK